MSLCSLLLLFFFAINNHRLAPSTHKPSKSRVSFRPGLYKLLSPFVSCKRRRRRQSTLACATPWPPDRMGSDGDDALPTDGRTKSSARALPTADGWLAARLDRSDRPCPAPQATAHETTHAGRPVWRCAAFLPRGPTWKIPNVAYIAVWRVAGRPAGLQRSGNE